MTRPDVDAIRPKLEDSGIGVATLSLLLLQLEIWMGMFPSFTRSDGTRGERNALGSREPERESLDREEELKLE